MEIKIENIKDKEEKIHFSNMSSMAIKFSNEKKLILKAKIICYIASLVMK